MGYSVSGDGKATSHCHLPQHGCRGNNSIHPFIHPSCLACLLSSTWARVSRCLMAHTVRQLGNRTPPLDDPLRARARQVGPVRLLSPQKRPSSPFQPRNSHDRKWIPISAAAVERLWVLPVVVSRLMITRGLHLRDSTTCAKSGPPTSPATRSIFSARWTDLRTSSYSFESTVSSSTTQGSTWRALSRELLS